MEQELADLHGAFEGGPPGDPNTVFVPGGAWHDFVKERWNELLEAIAKGPPPVAEPMFNIHYDFSPADAEAPANETATLTDAIAFAKQYTANRPGVTVTISFTP